MDLRPEHYSQASIERIEQARDLHKRAGRYALAMSTAGVAAECMLRAFLARRSPAFEGRHDVVLLFEASRMWRVDPDKAAAEGLDDHQLSAYRQDLGAAVQTVRRLWLNNYRYASEDRLRKHLHRAGLHEGIKGDFVKENARRLIEAVGVIVSRGTVLWELSQKK
jgi:hypothetical protein